MIEVEKKVKKKLNKKGLLVVILTLYLLIMTFYYCFNLPVKIVIVEGNNFVSDKEIISASLITDKTKFFALSVKGVQKNVLSLPMICDVDVTRHLTGRVEISVEETAPLYFKTLDNTYVLENGNITQNINLLGIPTLVNYVPSDIEKNLIKKLKNIDKDILYKVSEIEYSPDMKEEQVIDKNRFLLRMNDGNYVYINLANIDNLNKYEEIYATLDDNAKGVLNLDSSGSNGIIFQTFDFIKAKEGEQDELSKDS